MRRDERLWERRKPRSFSHQFRLNSPEELRGFRRFHIECKEEQQ